MLFYLQNKSWKVHATKIPIRNNPVEILKKAPYLDYRDRLKVTTSSHSKKETFNIHSSIFQDGEKEFPSGFDMHALNEISLEATGFHQPFTVGLYINETFLSDVTASGLIISTSTGSTAYGMSTGGSIVQTGVEAIWITAVMPTSISFRPIILPFDWRITLKVPKDVNEHDFSALIDGDFKMNLTDGDEIVVQGSSSPIPFISKEKEDPVQDWVKRLKSTVLSY